MLFKAALLLFLTALVVHASLDRDVIQGTITDSQNAVVPGAQVVITNAGTKALVRLTSNSDGFFLVSDLVPGEYSVHIEVGGFSSLDIIRIKVVAGGTTPADAHLQVGSTSETVNVTSAAPLIEEAPNIFQGVLPQIVFSLQNMQLYHYAEKRLLAARGIISECVVRDLRMDLAAHDAEYIDFLNANILVLLDRLNMLRCPASAPYVDGRVLA